MSYRCRAVRPVELPWSNVESVSPTEAAQTYQEFVQTCHQVTVRDDRDLTAGVTMIRFVLVEIEGHGELVSREFCRGLYRKGVAPMATFAERLKEAAKALGWTRDPEELVVEGWDLESEEWA